MPQAETGHNAQRNLKRNLTLRFVGLLSLFLILLAVSYGVTSRTLERKTYDSLLINLAGRQRMLSQKYTAQVNLALMGMVASDAEMEAKAKDAAAHTATLFEMTSRAFLEGGSTTVSWDPDEQTETVELPPQQAEPIRTVLRRVEQEWTELKQATRTALGVDSESLRNNDSVMKAQAQSARVLAETDRLVTMMQRDSEAKLRQLDSLQMVTMGTGCLLFIVLVGYVYAQIVVPLARSMSDIRSKNIKLQSEIEERKLAQEERDRVLRATGERVKELRCMYGVAESIRTRETLDQVFDDVVTLIPPGWQYPEIARCRIRFDDKEFVSQSFEETTCRQSADIVIAGERRGAVEVFYVEQCPELDEGPFLKEERDLIGGIVRSLSEAVEHHEAEINREKAEVQLRQGQKMEAIGRLAGGVAHDFNNILQVIQGYTKISLQNVAPDSVIRESLEEVKIASERAATLVSQLLAHSRRQVLDMKSADLNRLVADLTKMIRRLIGSHITLEVLAGHDLGTVCIDQGQLEQILMNLCINARDAMPEGGKIIIETENVLIDEEYTETHPWAALGRYVLMSVTDTGFGMDEETLGRIFEPFFTTKEVGKGTGLGLSTVYGLVKQHKGLLQVYSEVDKGTAVKIYLPLVERAATVVGSKIEGPAPGGSETILLAEDDASVRKLSVVILEQAGYTVLTAADGDAALLVFEEHADEIDLALLDVVMPGLGGRAVFEHIRRQRPQTRVLFSSGYSMNAIHTDFVLDEGLALIQKPCQSDDLLRRVRQVLDSSEEDGE